MSDLKPLYEHDCDECTWLGEYADHDLYFCAKGGSGGSVLARASGVGSDYQSMPVVLIKQSEGSPELEEALERAAELALVDGPIPASLDGRTPAFRVRVDYNQTIIEFQAGITREFRRHLFSRLRGRLDSFIGEQTTKTQPAIAYVVTEELLSLVASRVLERDWQNPKRWSSRLDLPQQVVRLEARLKTLAKRALGATERIEASFDDVYQNTNRAAIKVSQITGVQLTRLYTVFGVRAEDVTIENWGDRIRISFSLSAAGVLL
jgi:hypothetical protein